MTDMNTVAIVGRLTKDAEVKSSQDGKSAWGTFTVAVNRRVKSGDQWQDRADFFEVKASGPSYKGLAPYLTKGRQVGIAGYLVQDRWTDGNGKEMSRVKIFAESIQLLSEPKETQAQRPAPKQAPKTNGPESFESSDFDDLPDF